MKCFVTEKKPILHLKWEGIFEAQWRMQVRRKFMFRNSEIITCLLFSPTVNGYSESQKKLSCTLGWNYYHPVENSRIQENCFWECLFEIHYNLQEFQEKPETGILPPPLRDLTSFSFSENSLPCGVLLTAPFQAEPPIATSAASYGQSYWNLWISLILNLSSWFRWVNLKQFLKSCFFLTKWSAFWVMNSHNKMPCLKIYKIYFVVLFMNEFLWDVPCSLE